MAKNRIRTDLAVVRQALDLITAGHGYQEVGEILNRERSTIRKWHLRSLREPHGWPTPQDIEDWRADDAANAARRAVKAEKLRAFRRRQYLTRGAPGMVPACGVRRRLQALYALGWTSVDIADRLGMADSAVQKYTGVNPEWQTVKRTTHARFAAVYRDMCMTVPTHRAPMIHTRQRRKADRLGWAPPLAWDSDAHMDDPNASPRPWKEHRNDDTAA